jgi:hypothetical protein
MAGSDWAFLIGVVVSASSVALVSDALVAHGFTGRSSLILSASLVLLTAGLALALGADLPALPLLAIGVLTLAAGCYLVMRAYATFQPGVWSRHLPTITSHVPDRLAAALPIAGIVLLSWAALTGLDSTEASIPPPGTVIDATTGQILEKVPTYTTPQFVELESGDIFDACNFSRPPCKYAEGNTPLAVHLGDVVEFSIQLFDPSNQQVPYLKLYVIKGSRDTTSDLEVRLRWQAEHREWHISDYAPVEFPSLPEGGTDLTYIPGSTVLFDNHDQVIAHLPDGIMEAGIALTNVGAPDSCSYCESEYTRYVNFKVQVTDSGRT